MRPFISWPRWAIDLFVTFLRCVPVMPRLLFRFEMELWAREAVEVDGVRGWWWPATVGWA